MTVYELPLYCDQTARWTSKMDLGKDRFMLYFSWNSRCNYWEFSIYDNDEKLLVGGIRLVTMIDLLDEYKNFISKLPSGILQLVPRNDAVVGITRKNLNTDYSLIYVEK